MASEVKLEFRDFKATSASHHTDRFPEHPEWRVVRRGAGVPLTVVAEGSGVVQGVSSAYLVRVSDDDFEIPFSTDLAPNGIDLKLPVNCPIGLYGVYVRCALTTPGDSGSAAAAAGEPARRHAVESASLAQKLLVVANPWNDEDEVYLGDDAERQEYVLSSNGRVYAGSKRGMPWLFGQYRENSVLAVIALLAKCTEEDRKSVVRLSRRMTTLLNSGDDGGVLEGNWSGDYSGGTKPWIWQSSSAILDEYIVSGEQTVKYGQCWVFSALYAAVMRALGVPCRSVTNFDSAHDTDSNRSIDSYFDEDGEALDDMNNDSIWNFHVWNDCWMKRPDLPAGYSGWQAVDATPQEESKVGREKRSMYRMGPAPLHAIKEGKGCAYDTEFVISEVNADIREWVVKKDGPMEMSSVKRRGVGTAIVTKSVGNNRASYITSEYKYAEGTVSERVALSHAHSDATEEPVSFEVVTPSWEDLPVGSKVRIGVKMKNGTDLSQKVSLRIRARLCTYTGRTLKTLTPLSKSVQLAKESEREVESIVTPAQYLNEFQDRVLLVFAVYAQVASKDSDTPGQVFTDTHSIFLELPELRLKVSSEVGHKAVAAVRFEMLNPLRSNLTNIQVQAECDGLLRKNVELDMGNLGSAETLSGSFVIRGLEVGSHELLVGLTSDQLTGINASVTITVVAEGATQKPAVLSENDELDITDVDFKIPENRLAHHTEEYEDDTMVIWRRGQEAVMDIELSQPVKKVNVAFKFTLIKRIGGRRFSFTRQVANVPVHDNKLSVSASLPFDMPVGRYTLTVAVQTASQHVATFDAEDPIVVLFNPWCKDDEVYMENEEELAEYVMNETGGIWVGKYRRNRPMKWDFGQFDMASLETALFLIERVPNKHRHQAPMIVRYLSSALNSEDNNGVLVGNWSGDYADGTPPTGWIGSVEIFEQYMRSSRNTRKKPVKYGQCFIFSGIFTSALRTLGIPSRSVTNFRSAHDCHFNRAIDYYVGVDGDSLEDKNEDSIWNFHVWNEAWMKRSDLPYGYGGWQAVDSTPQELSEQVYCCGPASLHAIKMGQSFNYDSNFIIAEVNADHRLWVERKDSSFVLKRVLTDHVGKEITTKAPGQKLASMDITHLYKHPEGSVANRAALGANVTVGSIEGESGEGEKSDVGFFIDVHDAKLGDDVKADIGLKNTANESRTVTYRITARPLFYTGAGRGKAFFDTGKNEVVIAAGQGDSTTVTVKASEYLAKLQPHQQYWLEFVFFGCVKETDQTDVQTDVMELIVPELTVTLVDATEGNEVQLGQPVRVNITGDLSLSVPTKPRSAALSWNGRGLARNQKRQLGSVDRSKPFSAEITITPTLRGPRTLVVGLSSSELVNVDGSLDLNVV